MSQDGNGYVSTSELKFVMTRLNVYFSEDELQEVQEGARINNISQMSSYLDGLRGRY